jgi:hypothetical protein
LRSELLTGVLRCLRNASPPTDGAILWKCISWTARCWTTDARTEQLVKNLMTLVNHRDLIGTIHQYTTHKYAPLRFPHIPSINQNPFRTQLLYLQIDLEVTSGLFRSGATPRPLMIHHAYPGHSSCLLPNSMTRLSAWSPFQHCHGVTGLIRRHLYHLHRAKSIEILDSAQNTSFWYSRLITTSP